MTFLLHLNLSIAWQARAADLIPVTVMEEERLSVGERGACHEIMSVVYGLLQSWLALLMYKYPIGLCL